MSAAENAEVPRLCCVTEMPSVCDIAQMIPIDRADAPGMAGRLTSDPRMRPIWDYLRRRAQEMHDKGELERRLAVLSKPRYSPRHWGLPDAPAPDRACASFCACVIITLGVNNKAVTRAVVETETDKLNRLADELEARPLSEPRIERERAEHYVEIIAELRGDADSTEEAQRRHPSHILERSSAARGEDDMRAQAREIALGARAIFGSFLYGTVATSMSVALGRRVSEKSVRNWCSDL